MRPSTWRLLIVALAAVALVATGCGGDDDDDDAASTSSTTGVEDDGGEESSSEVEIGLVDFGYEVSGPLATGVQSFTTTNTGDEIHMLGIAKMKAGVTLDDVKTGLQAEGGEGEDPTAELFESEVGTPGHIIFPGTTQTITLDEGLEAGSYALVCFIPGEGDGVPHFAKGMLDELEVADDAGDAGAPEADAAYTLPDDAPAKGETSLEAGEVTLKLTNDGEIGKDFALVELDEGADTDAFDAFFTEVFEGDGPPEKGAAAKAPGTVGGNTFEIAPGQTIYLTAQVSPGTWTILSTTNVEGNEGEEPIDHTLVVTVT